MARTGHEDRNDRGQAVVAFVISTSEDSIRRALGVEWETVRSSASLSLDYRYNIVTHPHELLSSLDVYAYDANAIVCVYECSHPPLGTRLSSPLRYFASNSIIKRVVYTGLMQIKLCSLNSTRELDPRVG